MSNEQIPQEVKTDDKIINHIRNVKLLQAIYEGKKFFVEALPTDEDSILFPYSNFAVKEIELPNFNLFEEKMGYRWIAADQLKKKDEEIARLKEIITNSKFTMAYPVSD